MKKVKYFLVLASLTALLSSCFDELDDWYSETYDYAGRYVVATTCDEYSDDDQAIRDGNELLFYNSAANTANQIIYDSYIAINQEEQIRFHVKGKFDVTGNPSDFKATGSTTNIGSSTVLNDDEFYVLNDNGVPIGYPSGLPKPTAAGVEYPGIQLYSRISLDEGKIIPKGATTIGGNVSDSVYLAITAFSEYLTIESYQTPADSWVVPGVPEYAWRIKDGSRTNADGWEEHWKFSGYRYTGYPEDDPSTLPPITEK